MAHKKVYRGNQQTSENERIESIVEILDREMAAAAKNSRMKSSSDEMNTLVSDLLVSLSGDPED
ncbi:MAG: hypothetical protein P8Z37_14910 [Acidobacteriota bacterium]|jgi:hypothetical protein